MVEWDENDPGVEQEPVIGNVDELRSASENYVKTTEQLNQALSNLGVGQQLFGDIGSQSMAGAASNISSLGTGLEQVTKYISGLSQENENLKRSDPSQSLNNTGDAAEKAGKSLSGYGKIGQQSMDFLKKNFTDMQQSFASGVALFGIKKISEGVKKLGDETGFNMIQKQLSDLEKTALQASIGFGESFENAAGDLNFMHQSIAETILTTKRMPEEIMEVRKSLSEAFGGTKLTTNIARLSDANTNLSSAVNVTNMALLVSSATGMKATAVADLMSKAHLELGESVADAGSALGEIALVAEKSGMQFEKVAKSITDSANTLKMWGGTVGAVTPMFDAFSRSLGEGRKGLATDMIQKFSSGLENMGLNMRALMGLQMPGGAGKGAIGAGLEMEAALEGGAGGMQKVSESLIATLKQFAGGRVVTRQEAIENPALERNFLIQRQLLKQMMGVDTATGTRMLSALQDVDEHGLSMGKDSNKALAEMMGKGESVQDKATTTLEKAQHLTTSKIQTHGKNILNSLDNVADKTGIGKLIGIIETVVTESAKTGRTDLGPLLKALQERNINVSNLFDDGAVSAVARSLGHRERGAIPRDETEQARPMPETGVPAIDALTRLQETAQRSRGGMEGQLSNREILQTALGVEQKKQELEQKKQEQGKLGIEDEKLLSALNSHGDVIIRSAQEFGDLSISQEQYTRALGQVSGITDPDEALSGLSDILRAQSEQNRQQGTEVRVFDEPESARLPEEQLGAKEEFTNWFKDTFRNDEAFKQPSKPIEEFTNWFKDTFRGTEQKTEQSQELTQQPEKTPEWTRFPQELPETQRFPERFEQPQDLPEIQPEKTPEWTRFPQESPKPQRFPERFEQPQDMPEIQNFVERFDGPQDLPELQRFPEQTRAPPEFPRYDEDIPPMLRRDFGEAEERLPEFRPPELPIKEAQVVTKEVKQIEHKITAQTQFEPVEIEAKLKITPDQNTITIQPDAEFIELVARGQIVNNPQ